MEKVLFHTEYLGKAFLIKWNLKWQSETIKGENYVNPRGPAFEAEKNSKYKVQRQKRAVCLICARKNKEASVVRIEWKRWKVVNEDREVIRSCNTLRAKVNRHSGCFSEWHGPVADFKQRRRQRKKQVDWSSREGDDSGLYQSSSNGDEKGSNSSYF